MSNITWTSTFLYCLPFGFIAANRADRHIHNNLISADDTPIEEDMLTKHTFSIEVDSSKLKGDTETKGTELNYIKTEIVAKNQLKKYQIISIVTTIVAIAALVVLAKYLGLAVGAIILSKAIVVAASSLPIPLAFSGWLLYQRSANRKALAGLDDPEIGKVRIY